MPKVKGTPLHIIAEGFLDEVIGIITDGFIIEVEEPEPTPPGPPTPPGRVGVGGMRPRRIIMIGLRGAMRKRRQNEVLIALMEDDEMPMAITKRAA